MRLYVGSCRANAEPRGENPSYSLLPQRVCVRHHILKDFLHKTET